MDPKAKIKVSKIDAARRQLDCAIKLWFEDGDEVSVHTLTFAAYEIIDDLNVKHGNIDNTLLGMAKKYMPPERIEDMMRAFKKAMIFFKHADRDPHVILDFDPQLSEMMLMFTIQAFNALGERLTAPQHAFVIWAFLHNAKLHEAVKEKLPESVTVQGLDQLRRFNKAQFFKTAVWASATAANRL